MFPKQAVFNTALGLEIRDYIAIEAMKALIPIYTEKGEIVPRSGYVTGSNGGLIAKVAYQCADALIVESNNN